MSSTQERLCTLYNEIGIRTDKGISKAEIIAYSDAIDMVHEELSQIIVHLFPIKSLYKDYEKYIELIGEIIRKINNNVRNEIIANRFSGEWGNLSMENVNRVFEYVANQKGNYSLSDGLITFTRVAFEDLPKLGQFIKGYVPACTEVTFSGRGLKFSAWDNRKMRWFDYDKLCLPFDVLDKMEVFF